MPLEKTEAVTVIPAVDAVEGRPETTFCLTPPPDEDDGGMDLPGDTDPPDDSGGYESNDRIYLYDVNGDNRTPSFAPAPAGYTCSTGQFFLPDPTFPGGQIPVYETRCYQDP